MVARSFRPPPRGTGSHHRSWPNPERYELARPGRNRPAPVGLRVSQRAPLAAGPAPCRRSLRHLDLGAKAALYASAGIPEYWVLDLTANRIVVHRDPIGERYNSIVAYDADEAVTPLAAESASIRLNDLAS